MSKQKTWERHMRSYERSGGSKKAYCEKHKLNLHTFDYWRSKLRKKEEESGFVKVESSSGNPEPLAIETGSLTIRVPEGFSRKSLELVLEVASARD